MTSNVIPMLLRRFEDALAEFRQSCRLASFLKALSILGETTIVDSRLQEAWNQRCHEVVCGSPLNEVLDWCALHEFHESLVDYAAPTDQIPTEFHRALHDVVAMAEEESRYYREVSESPENPYWRIEVAWTLRDALKDAFGNDDPALYLATFMRALFPKLPAQARNHKVTTNEHVRSFIHKTLVPWALATERLRCERQRESDDVSESVSAECRLDQIEDLEKVLDRLVQALSLSKTAVEKGANVPGLRELVEILPYLPQIAFERVTGFLVAAYEIPKIFDSTGHGFGLFLDVVTSLPVGKPFEKRDVERFPENSFINSMAHKVFPDEKYPFLPVPFLSQIFDLIASTSGYVPVEVVKDLELDNGCMTISVLRDRIQAMLRRITRRRRGHPNPFAGITTDEWHDINFWLTFVAADLDFDPDYDPFMRLAVHSTEPPSLSIFSQVLSAEVSAYGRASIFDDLASTYRAVNAEGWYEAGTACLALFLVAQPLRYAGQLYADWSKLGPMLAESSRLPGARRVEVAARLAMEYCKKMNGDTPDVLALKGWAAKEQAKWPEDVDDLSVDRHQIERQIRQDIGKENWSKMRRESVIQLVDAEALWSAIHMQVGRGQQDFGSIANGFVKAIEGELGYHLSPVFDSLAYESWKGSDLAPVVRTP